MDVSVAKSQSSRAKYAATSPKFEAFLIFSQAIVNIDSEVSGACDF